MIARNLLPAEHGAWGWWLIPFLSGVIIAGRWNLPLVLFFVSALGGFLIRQPAVVWLRASRGKADSPRRRDARALIMILLIPSVAAMTALLRIDGMIWFAAIFSLLLALYVYSNLSGRKVLRSLPTELLGSAALAAVGPAAILAANGRILVQEWAFGLLMVLLNVLGVLYVRLRIADTRGFQTSRILIAAAHAGGLIMAGVLCHCFHLPALILPPFGLLLIRALWFSARPHAISNMKYFGFAELLTELQVAIWIALQIRT